MVISTPFKLFIGKGNAVNVTKREAMGCNSEGVLFY